MTAITAPFQTLVDWLNTKLNTGRAKHVPITMIDLNSRHPPMNCNVGIPRNNWQEIGDQFDTDPRS